MIEALYGTSLAMFEGLADGLIKYAAISKSSLSLFLGFLGYNGLAFILYQGLLRGFLWKINAYWDITSHFVDLVVALVIFKEKITLNEFSGLVLAIAGIVIMETQK